MEIKDRIRELLEITGDKQSDMALKTGLSRPTISMYLHGNREPKSNIIFLIAQTYNVNEAWLLGYDVPMERQKKFNKSEAEIDSAMILDNSARAIIAEYNSLSPENKILVQEFIKMLKNR